jgi:hypothetical protein
MVEDLQAQMQSKRDYVKAKYDNINNVATKAKEMVATKATNKVRLTKYNKSLVDENLKSTQTIKQVHPSFQTIEPTNLGLKRCLWQLLPLHGH